MTDGRNRADLDSNEMLRLALVRALEVVGEAAARISEETAALSPEVPWHELKGMRNRLIHAYFDVNLDIVWTTATREAPELLHRVRTLIEADPS